MGPVRFTSWYPKFNGSHFGLPPSSIHRMDWTGWQFRVNYDVFAQATSSHMPEGLIQDSTNARLHNKRYWKLQVPITPEKLPDPFPFFFSLFDSNFLFQKAPPPPQERTDNGVNEYERSTKSQSKLYHREEKAKIYIVQGTGQARRL